jgi:23S rRNA (cytosine1962-C5)-methyltransferase
VDRWKAGHPWIYRADLESTSPSLAGGEVARVVDERGWFLGQAFYSDTSKIALRWLTAEDVPVDRAFFARRLAQADAMRRRAFPDADTYRVVHGEADLLPGLVVDRYGDGLSLQLLIQGTERHGSLLVDVLREHFQPKVIVNRSDVHVRTYEGLPPQKGLLLGEAPPPPHVFRNGAVRMAVDLLEGQ